MVSPWALKDEFIDISRKIKIEPKKIIFIYFKDNSSVSISLFIKLINDELKYIPNEVTKIEIKIESINDCEKILPDISKLFSPILFAIKEVVPILNPIPKAIIIK